MNSNLRDCVCVCVELKVTRSNLLDSEREKSELAVLARQRLEEAQRLNRYWLNWV